MRTLVDAGRSAGELSVSLRARWRDATGDWEPLRCVLSSLAGSTDRCLVLAPDPLPPEQGGNSRLAELERHLRTIAAEVEASGVLAYVGDVPQPARLPQLGALTARQWEVLNRLVRGERVQTIAAALFVSQSTVRNHLTAVFERFGVHSQVELLALLSGAEKPPVPFSFGGLQSLGGGWQSSPRPGPVGRPGYGW